MWALSAKEEVRGIGEAARRSELGRRGNPAVWSPRTPLRVQGRAVCVETRAGRAAERGDWVRKGLGPRMRSVECFTSSVLQKLPFTAG